MRRINWLSALAMTLTACASSAVTQRPCPACPTPPPPVHCAAAVEAAAPAVAAVEPPATPPVTVIATARGDLDDDGDEETITLMSDGRFMRSAAGRDEANVGQIEGFEPLSMEFYGAHTQVLSVIDIDRRDDQRELMVVEMRGDEDPDAEYRFYALRNGMLWPLLRRTGSASESVMIPHGVRPVIAGDGSVRFAWSRCARDRDERTGALGLTERTVLRYVLSDGGFRRSDLIESVTTTRAPARCVMAG